jgi:predicted dehydrogenase
LRAGVIGLGVGEQHALSYAAIPGVELRVLCDRDPVKLAEVGARYPLARRVTDYRAVVEDPEVDVVSICSYDDHHAAQAIAAFRHGKHVMIEKPVALDRTTAEAVLRAQQDSGKLITSNLILRRSPRFRKIRAMARAGEFGEIFYLEGDYIHDILWKITEGWRGRMDFYCVTFGGGIHLIDLMRWILGEEVVEVAGMGNKILTRGTAYKYDDTIVNLLRFANGALGKCLTTFGPRRPKFHALNVYGTRRTFVNDLPDGKLFSGDRAEDELAETTPYPAIAKGDLLPDFIAAIREGREPEVSARDVFRVMAVCLAAWDATQSGRTVPVSYMI